MATFVERFAREDGAAEGVSFARFMALALYDPEFGFYRRNRRRVGRAGADFTTATTVGPVFGELVAAAAAALLGGRAARDHVFVEIGAEPGTGVLDGVEHPFGAAQCVRLGDDLQLPPQAVVFSNELFDAQPFHRLVWSGRQWRESGVAMRDGALVEVELPQRDASLASQSLPKAAPEGYRLDVPLAAARLMRRIVELPWRGLLLAFDYGRTWAELTEDCPAGTGRAYREHRQVTDLLAHPGEQDLTCHVCWDWLAAEATAAGFGAVRVDSQEAFLVRQAGAALQRITAGGAAGFSPRVQAVHQLLHPALMGQKFQVLSGLRI